MAIIHRFFETCKAGLTIVEPYLLPVALVLLTFFAFGLGRLSMMHEDVMTVSERPKEEGSALHIGGEVVALNSGKVYYAPWCKGADIPEGRARWFPSKEAAERAGLSPAKGCKGL